MTEKRLVFEIGAIEFIEWLNENRLYLAYVTAIMNKEFLKMSLLKYLKQVTAYLKRKLKYITF